MFERLRHLPRDSRDTLFLLAVIGWVLLPQVAHLPLWCSLLCAAVLAGRGWLAWGSRPLPSRWWLLGLLALTLAATWATHRTLLGRDAGVTLIAMLLALKTLELRARRDAFVVFFLGFFTMLTNFFFSQSLPTAAAMLVALLGLLTALVNAHMPVGRPPLLQAAKTAGWMALLGAPIMAVLFVLFPRFAPLWGIPSDAMSGRSGLSANMQVGTIASLALDESIAMRVRFEGPPPPQSALYFRGPVLSSFDGREWLPLRSSFSTPFQAAPALRVSGEPVRYEVTLEPHNRPWLLVLDAAGRAPLAPGYDTVMTPELQWFANRPITDITRYRAESHLEFQHGPQRFIAALQDYTALPPGFNPRTLQWASELRADPRMAGADTAAMVRRVLEQLRTGGYTYSLEPGTYGQHTADELWFDRKEGFCEHFASAFVVLMRAMDIPARIVTGYQGGEVNAVDGYWTVRQSDAHAWTEVWHPGQGWLRVDPTAAVMPGRIGASQRLVAPRGALASAIGSVSPGLATSLRAAWEAMNNGWNQWVLNYTQSRQLNLLKNLGFEAPSWEDLGYVLIAVIVAVSLGGALWTLWERREHDPWLRLLGRARARLAASGLATHAAQPPRQLAALVRQHFAGRAEMQAVHDWLLRLEALRYAPSPASRAQTAAALATLQREFKALAWPASSTA
jgi:protein-glutamine gamma-glutamyltransferase